MKDILDHSKPIHIAKDLWHAKCGALWWQVSDNPAVVNCSKCKRLLTKRAPDVKPRRAVKAKTRKASRG